MGADGGSIAKRSELVTSLPAKVSTDLPLESKWVKCALSSANLTDPVVCDWNGNLYNKSAVLQYLGGQLPSNQQPPTQIQQIRDLVSISREFNDANEWIDPLTEVEVEVEAKSDKIGLIAECGHILPGKLFKLSSCSVCAHSFTNYIIINPTNFESEQHNKARINDLQTNGLSNSLRGIKLQPPTNKRKPHDESALAPKKPKLDGTPSNVPDGSKLDELH